MLPENFTRDNTYVCIDFDGTISKWTVSSTGKPMSTIAYLADQPSMNKWFETEAYALYRKYRPIELDSKLSSIEKEIHMKEWWEQVFWLLEKHWISKEVFLEAEQNIDKLELRIGMSQFFQEMQAKEIPVIVFSAGIGNIILHVLNHYNLLTRNISVISNIFYFNDAHKVLIPSWDNLIHASNKDSRHFWEEIFRIISGRENIIVIGDNPHDKDMASHVSWKHNIYSVWFLNYPDKNSREGFWRIFDTVVESHDSTLWILEQITWKL